MNITFICLCLVEYAFILSIPEHTSKSSTGKTGITSCLHSKTGIDNPGLSVTEHKLPGFSSTFGDSKGSHEVEKNTPSVMAVIYHGSGHHVDARAKIIIPVLYIVAVTVFIIIIYNYRTDR